MQALTEYYFLYSVEKGAVTPTRWRGHPRPWLEPLPSTPTPSRSCTLPRPRSNYQILGNDLTHQILATCQKPAHPNCTKCSHRTIQSTTTTSTIPVYSCVYDNVLTHISTFFSFIKLSLSMHEFAIDKYKCICFWKNDVNNICNCQRILLIWNSVFFQNYEVFFHF